MAQLYYRYSKMNAGKSIELIKVAYNYEERGKHGLTLEMCIRDRSRAAELNKGIFCSNFNGSRERHYQTAYCVIGNRGN